MAPKRTSGQGVESAKRAKTDPMVDAVIESIDNAEGLNDSCKTMLKIASPFAFSVPSDERNAIQQDIVVMIGDIIKQSETSLQTFIEKELANVATANEQQYKLIQVSETHQKELQVATTKVETLQHELDAAIADTKLAEANLAESMESQVTGDKQHELVKSERARLQSIISKFIKREDVVCDVDLATLAKSLSLDESLTIALPKACAKELDARTAFDSMVVDEFQKILDSRTTDLSKQIDEEAPNVVSREKVVEEALQVVSTKKEFEEAKRAEHSTAVEAQKKCEVVMQSSEEAVLHGEINREKATNASDAAKAKLEKFKEGPSQCFETLRDRPSQANVAGA